MSARDSRRVYALIETSDGAPWDGGEAEDGELWMSRDGGDNWTVQTKNRNPRRPNRLLLALRRQPRRPRRGPIT